MMGGGRSFKAEDNNQDMGVIFFSFFFFLTHTPSTVISMSWSSHETINLSLVKILPDLLKKRGSEEKKTDLTLSRGVNL